jgi:hypothetical protein
MITHKTSNLVINKDKIPLDTYNYLRGVDTDLKNIFQALVEIKAKLADHEARLTAHGI